MLEQTCVSRWGAQGKVGVGALALGVLLSSGCGGLGPGDYVVYRVAFSEPALTADCFGGSVPVDEAEDTSTLRTAGSFILYVGANDKFYLDIGTNTLEGVQTGDAFAFTGQSHDVSIIDTPPDEVRIVEDRSITIDFTLDGELIDGSIIDFQGNSCTGPAGSCPDPPNYSCTQTSTFVGTEVHDVRIEHDV